MSSRARRMALGLATLTLLTSLFLVAQGFLRAPEALASCPERTWCESYVVDLGGCCCPDKYHMWARMHSICYWQEWDCTINAWYTYFDEGCYGSFCWCY